MSAWMMIKDLLMFSAVSPVIQN